MQDSLSLLDTPKKKSLQSEAESLRVALKEYEHTFAADHDGRKPSRDEIKANKNIAVKYQQYQNIRDVLAGKRSLAALKSPKQHQPARKRHERTDSAISLTPHRPTTSSRAHPNDVDPYDPPSSISPRVLPNAIGPTPRRDGTVLGIFDMLSNSGSSRNASQQTPSSKKRKIDMLFESENRGAAHDVAVAQTPSQKRRQSTENDSGVALTATTPRTSCATGKRNHSKTPVSEGKKFMLNHFFATPSAVRFAAVIGSERDTSTPAPAKTPLRDMILGISPAKKSGPGQDSAPNVDATPPYLKRSFSFKERLLSAFGDPKTSRNSTARSLSSRFAPKPLSQIIAERQQAEEKDRAHEEQRRQRPEDPNDEDDELDALREMEATEINVLVEDSQLIDESGQPLARGDEQAEEQPVRTWKKRGQKRTTRRVIMRPVKFQAPVPQMRKGVPQEDADEDEDCDDEGDNTVSRVDEIQLPEMPASEIEQNDSDMDFLDDDHEEVDPKNQQENESGYEDEFHSSKYVPEPKSKQKSKAKATSSSKTPQTEATTLGKPPKAQPPEKTRTINPNAHSHMNFRSLKIKNKNSKAKGRGRFGRGRR